MPQRKQPQTCQNCEALKRLIWQLAKDPVVNLYTNARIAQMIFDAQTTNSQKKG